MKIVSPKIQALIFDMDGVIVDSELPKFQYLQGIYTRMGMQLPDKEFPHIIGRTVMHFLKERWEEKDMIMQIWNEFEQGYLKHIEKYITPNPSTINYIKNYRGPVKLTIASNGIGDINKKIVEFTGISPYISLILSRESVTHLKPHPEIYLKTAELLQIDPIHCVVIEDSLVGIEAAHKAGMKSYLYANTYNQSEKVSELRIEGIVETTEDLFRITS